MISPSILQSGLSEQELDELERFLREHVVPAGGMELSVLDGYMTAIVSGPELIPPSEWLPRAWGQRGDEKPGFVFESTAQAERSTLLVLRRMNEIARDFGRGEISPIFLESRDDTDGADGSSSESADAWCLGYLAGVQLRAESWKPLHTGDDNVLLLPIFALAAPLLRLEEGPTATLRELVSDDRRGELIASVPRAALDIYRYWLDRRRAPSTPLRIAPRPGRNEPCPCGSGKKYKKCCGQ